MVHNYAANEVGVEIDVIETYTTLPGVRLNYLVCENQKNRAEFCPTTAIISVAINENWIRTNRNHNHYLQVVNIPLVHLRRSIGMSGTSSGRMSKSLRNIYNNEIIVIIHFSNPQASVQRMCHCCRPPNPDTIKELAGILNEHNMAYASTLYISFFQQLFEAEGETVGIVFFNFDAIEKYRNELLSVRVAGIDGTFKTVPKRPPQFTKGCLLTFHVLFHNVVIRDYERGLMNAVRSIFIESNLQGCWFHYCQAVIWYCRRTLNSVFHLFQNSPEAHRVLRMVFALPHLPAKIHPECQFTMAEGFNTIVEYANGMEEISEQLQNIRTNNYLESFHSTLLSQLGRHPNIWDYIYTYLLIPIMLCELLFMGKKLRILLSIENQYYIEMDQARRNLNIRNNTTRVRRTEASSKIKHYIQLFNEEQDILMFLKRAGHTMDGYNEGWLGPLPLEP
ncbi:hypothetical protein QTP88_013979 [Uroleucon formosanum]